VYTWHGVGKNLARIATVLLYNHYLPVVKTLPERETLINAHARGTLPASNQN
jgi:hypothetical protein